MTGFLRDWVSPGNDLQHPFDAAVVMPTIVRPVIVEALTAVLIKLRSESGLSIILVEQNSRVAFEFSDRSVVLDKGRIGYDGASAVLRDDPERLAKVIGVSE